MKASDITRLIQELDDDHFEIRQRARQRLEELGDMAQVALTQALAQTPSAEVRRQTKELLDILQSPPTGDNLRFLRAVEVLESIDSPDSRRILKRLAGGDPNALLTREAKAALDRLNTE